MSTNKPLTIVVPPEHRQEFLDLYHVIRIYRDIERPVPSSIAMRIFELMWEPDQYRENLLLIDARALAIDASEQIAEVRGLELNWKFRKEPDDGSLNKPDTQQIISEMIYGFFLYKHDYKDAGKDEAVAFFHSAFEYYIELLEEESKNALKPYKKGIAAGILTMAVGFQLTDKANPSHKDIYQATRNAISKNLMEDDQI